LSPRAALSRVTLAVTRLHRLDLLVSLGPLLPAATASAAGFGRVVIRRTATESRTSRPDVRRHTAQTTVLEDGQVSEHGGGRG
jgi:hypothetical protein